MGLILQAASTKDDERQRRFSIPLFPKLRAFLRRGFLLEARYKFAFVSRIGTVLLALCVVHFTSQLVDAGKPAALAKYGGSYFNFAVVGVSMGQYFAHALHATGDNLRRAQLSGVLEALLSSGTRPARVVLYDAVYGFSFAALHFLIISAIGATLVGARFDAIHPLGLVLAIALGTSAVASLGVFSAAWTVMFKTGDPVPLLVGGIGSLVSGVYFPVSLLPQPVQWLSQALPVTHALEAARLALSAAASPDQMARRLAILAAMTVVLLPISLWSFELAVTVARRRGTLLHY